MKLKTMVLTVGATALLLVGMAAVAPTVASPATTTAPAAAPVKQDNSGKCGLLGLLGLAGLLKRPRTEVRAIACDRRRMSSPTIAAR